MQSEPPPAPAPPSGSPSLPPSLTTSRPATELSPARLTAPPFDCPPLPSLGLPPLDVTAPLLGAPPLDVAAPPPRVGSSPCEASGVDADLPPHAARSVNTPTAAALAPFLIRIATLAKLRLLTAPTSLRLTECNRVRSAERATRRDIFAEDSATSTTACR